ncbi:Endopeptidase IV signal peptide peptidase [Planctomycetales bacterium 10988]|nr:Endopeptidase IV signal peptide peptidase [Planctomycetales bacterium 10988]
MDTNENYETESQPAPQATAPSAPRAASGGSAWSSLLLLGLIFSVLFNLLLLFIFLITLSLAPTGESLVEEVPYNELNPNYGGEKVAILRLEEVIMEGEDSYLAKQIEQIKEDEDIKAMVLRVNSPGGMVSGSDYLYHKLIELQKEKEIPMVVSMGTIAASGGYYIAMASGEQKTLGNEGIIFAEPTTWTGSIGVIIPHYNLAGFAEEWGIEEDSIKSHPLKGMGGVLTKLTPKEEEVLQSLVNDSFKRFKEIVLFGRPMLKEEDLDEVATGQVFTADQALEHQLVDKIGYLDDAIDHALSLAKIDREDAYLVEYEAPVDFFSLFSAQAKVEKNLHIADVLSELNNPKAYYLYAWMPGLPSPKTTLHSLFQK